MTANPTEAYGSLSPAHQAFGLRHLRVVPGAAARDVADPIALIDAITSEPDDRFRVLSSFLALEGSRVRRDEGWAASAAFEEIRARVLAVARVHHQLMRQDGPPEVDFRVVLATIAKNLLSSFGAARGPVLSWEAHGRLLPAGQCVWPTLIASELVAGILKYGFLGGRRGRIAVFFAAGAASWVLEIEDSGSPWRPAGSRRGAGTLVIQALVEFLDGQLEIADVSGGNRCKVIMPLH